MAAGREADQTVAGKGDTVTTSSSLLNLMQKWTPKGDTVTASSSLIILMQKGPTIGDTVERIFLIAKVAN